jgi:hypothetical protein
MRGPQPLRIIDLDSRHCKFPIGGEGEFTEFCGEERVVGWPYCSAHIARAYRLKAVG